MISSWAGLKHMPEPARWILGRDADSITYGAYRRHKFQGLIALTVSQAAVAIVEQSQTTLPRAKTLRGLRQVRRRADPYVLLAIASGRSTVDYLVNMLESYRPQLPKESGR